MSSYLYAFYHYSLAFCLLGLHCAIFISFYSSVRLAQLVNNCKNAKCCLKQWAIVMKQRNVKIVLIVTWCVKQIFTDFFYGEKVLVHVKIFLVPMHINKLIQ